MARDIVVDCLKVFTDPWHSGQVGIHMHDLQSDLVQLDMASYGGITYKRIHELLQAAGIQRSRKTVASHGVTKEGYLLSDLEAASGKPPGDGASGVLCGYEYRFGRDPECAWYAAWGGRVIRSATRENPDTDVALEFAWRIREAGTEIGEQVRMETARFESVSLETLDWSVWFFGPTLELAFNQAKIYHWRLMRLHREHPNAENPFGEAE